MRRQTPPALTPERLAALVAYAERGPIRGDVSMVIEYQRECRAIIRELAAGLRTVWDQQNARPVEQLNLLEHRDAAA